MEKQMTFWKDKRALRRIDGRYNSLVTMSVWMWTSLGEEKIRVAPKEGIYYN